MPRLALSAACLFAAAALAAAQAPAKPAAIAVGAAPVPAAAPATANGTLPSQTPILLQLETHLSTRDNKYGDGFAARVMKPVYLNGHEEIPSGSILEGHVVRVRDERPAQGDSELLLLPDLLSTPDGHHYTISAEVIQNDPLSDAKVDSEGTLIEPRGLMHTDVTHAEIGAGGGVVAGALLLGAKGALVGGGIGAAVGVGIWLVRYRHLELNPGSQLTVRLDRPLQMIPQSSSSPSPEL